MTQDYPSIAQCDSNQHHPSPNSNTPPQTPQLTTTPSKSATTPSAKDSTKIAGILDAATPSSKQSGSVDKSKSEEARNKKSAMHWITIIYLVQIKGKKSTWMQS